MRISQRAAASVIGALIVLSASRAEAQLNYSRIFALGEASGQVNAMLVWDEDGAGPNPAALFIGGGFTNVGGVPAARIARWDGTNWSALGIGIAGGDVHALAAYDDDGPGPNPERLIAAGSFISAGGNTVDRIARWNGTAWAALPGGGLNSQVNTLCVYQGQLYAGGFFTQANPSGLPVSATGLAQYNGFGWIGRSVGSTTVYALAVHDDGQGGGPQLYVGGTFSSVPGVTGGSRIARFNGAVFSAVGGGVSGTVNGGASGPRVTSLCVHNGQLYAGGAFANAGEATGVNSVARWDGTAWNGVGGGVVVTDATGARCMASYAPPGQSARLYVGGTFTAVGPGGSVAANRIAAFDGTSWSALGTGLNSLGPNTLGVYPASGAGSALQACGNITSAGGFPAVNMGRWDGTKWNTLGLGFKSTAAGAAIRVIRHPHNPALPTVPPASGAESAVRGDGPPTHYERSVVYVGGSAFSPGIALNSTAPTSTMCGFSPEAFPGPDPYAFLNPGDNNGTILDINLTEDDEVIGTGNFSMCNGQPAGGMCVWNPLSNTCRPFGLPGIVGGTGTGESLLKLPPSNTRPERFRIFTNAFEIGGLNAPWGSMYIPGPDFIEGSFLAFGEDEFPGPTDGPVTESEPRDGWYHLLQFCQSIAQPPENSGVQDKPAVVGGNYSNLQVGTRTVLGNAYVNFVSLATGAVFAPGQPPTGPCTALAWCPKSFADKTGFIVVAGGPTAIAGYNGTSWVVIGNAKNNGSDGLVGDIAFMNCDNDPEWEMIVGGTITNVLQNGVPVTTCRNLLRADATGLGTVAWSKITDPVTGVDGTDNTVWALEYAITVPPPPMTQALTHTMLVGGMFRSAGGYSAGRFTVIYGPTIAPACFADFNDDGVVNTADLTAFLGRFASPASSSDRAFRADFNRDGTVNTPDLVYFIGRFGQTCP